MTVPEVTMLLAYAILLLTGVLYALAVPAAPLIAALLFFGFRAPRRHFVAAMGVLMAVDIYLTRVHYAYPLPAEDFVKWAFWLCILFLGGMLKENARPLRVAAASLSGSAAFFVLSNFAVWASYDLYPKNLAGLMMSYVAAVPFYRANVISDLAASLVVFGLAAAMSAKRAEQRAAA
jgi:hypothetical protein